MVTGVQSNNSIGLLDQIVHSGGGGGPCNHTHTQDEGLYVVSGGCTFNAGGQNGMKARRGDFVAIPGATEHSFTVDEPDTQLLNFYVPAGFELLLIGIAHPAPVNAPPPPESIPDMLPPAHLVHKLAADYGMDAVLGMPFVNPAGEDNMLTKPTPGASVFPFLSSVTGGEGRADVPTFRYRGGIWHVLASGHQTGGSYTLLEAELPTSEGPETTAAPYLFESRDEMFYVLDGEMTYLLGERIETIGTGGSVFIPKGELRGYRVEKDSRVLNWHMESGFERVLEVLAEGGEETPPDVQGAKKELVCRELGMAFPAVLSPF